MLFDIITIQKLFYKKSNNILLDAVNGKMLIFSIYNDKR